MSRISVSTTLCLLALGLSACGGGHSSTMVTAPSLTGVAVSSSSGSINAGLTVQLTATASYSDHSTKDVTSQATWMSSNASDATVSSSGVVTGVAAGSVTITATWSGQSGTMAVTVNPAAVTTIAVTSTASLVNVGATLQLTATATYSDSSTKNVTSQATWMSSNTSEATVSTAGLVTGVAAGPATITATFSGQSGNMAVTVNAVTVTSIAVTSSSSSVNVGATLQMTATATYSDSSTQNVTSQATWTSSNTSDATVSTAGLVTGVASGAATITATFGGKSGSDGLTVTSLTVTGVAVTSSTSTVNAGGTLQMTATATYSDSSTKDVTSQATWTSSNTADATVSTLGVVSAIKAGSATITAAFSGQSGQEKVTVTAVLTHVVIIFQENRTPDNLFQDPVLISRGADIASQGVNSKGKTITLQKTSLTQDYDLNHSRSGYLAMYDGGKMDGTDLVTLYCPDGGADCPCSQYASDNGISCPLPNPQFYYIDPTEVQPYFTMAETYTFGDRMFQSNEGPSFPAHQYIISGTSSMGTNAPGGNANLFIAENPPKDSAGDIITGCAVPSNTLVRLIDITNPDNSTNETQTAYPCAEHNTLIDLLDQNNLTWRYYSVSPTAILTGPNAIEHLCGPNATPPNATLCTSFDWTNYVIEPKSAQVLTDIANGELANVTWVIPNGQDSDHNVATDGSGPSWVASIVNAIGNSDFWSNTAIIVTWDDWGGWFDHVAPPLIANNSYEQGFRVPLIVISPYVKAAYISHTNHDFGSILHFIENTFDLPFVDPSYDDARADDLSDCFNFNQTPLVFQTIDAPLKADYFINDTSPPLEADDE